jgi:hypothetical protein
MLDVVASFNEEEQHTSLLLPLCFIAITDEL